METLVKHLDDRKYIKWDNKYSVGISIIDEQHKKLFGFINKTIEAKEHSDNKEELEKVLEKVTTYALEHF
jgi:hemerythrin-like metal-binding protein